MRSRALSTSCLIWQASAEKMVDVLKTEFAK